MNSKDKKKYRQSKKWKEFRQHILIKYDYTCQVCGIRKTGKQSRYLQVHHLNPKSYGKETDDDVTLLCSADHELIEKLIRRKSFSINDFCKRIKLVFIGSKK